MKYTTIRIEGAIFSGDILERLEQGELGGQSYKDFGFEARTKVKDEIAKAWADAQDMWRIFSRQRERLKESDYGTSETRKYWIVPLLGVLGYNADYASKAETVNERSYAVSHRALNIDNYPIHIMGINESLDRKRQDTGPRMSPHGLMQEYLNLTEHLYALVTNGKYLRLLRDSSRLIKLSFLEFDLERMMEDQCFADFAIMFRLLHVSRMPQKMDQGPESLIEKYHQDSLEAGSRIRDGLSKAIKYSIERLAVGFLQNPLNIQLIKEIEGNRISSELFYQYMLRLIYRLLFLMVVEERDLIYPKDADKRKRDIYYNYYSVNRLRGLCEKRYLADKSYDDVWLLLKNTFRLFEFEDCGSSLDIKPLAGDLFSLDAIGILSECDLTNDVLLTCILQLSVFTHSKTGQTMRINYRALNVEEFGSVYEGLLEFSPELIKADEKYKLLFKEGSERSSSGSHYTPDELVQPLIKHSLDYIIEDKLKEANKEAALLSITVCDVACGSGHILLNAARRIGFELAKVRTGEDQPSPDAMRIAIRDVIRNCIYGVDKNQLAVELCKVSLWLEAHVPGEPLGFLDHRIKCGDAIVGLAHKAELERGIPDEAFKQMLDDDKQIRQSLAKQNKTEKKESKDQLKFDSKWADVLLQITSKYDTLYKMPEKTPQDLRKKKEAYLSTNKTGEIYRLKRLADCQVAQFFIPKTQQNKERIITHAEYMDLLSGRKPLQGQHVAAAHAEGHKRKFFHWFLEFPEIFENGGFDCVLGNPPFLGYSKLSGSFGDSFLEYIKYEYSPAMIVDLVTYFFRRIFDLIKKSGYLSLISTNTICQGNAREGGLFYIQQNDGEINFAIRSIKWPGLAAVEVSLVGIYKGKWIKEYILNSKKVETISSYLDDSNLIANPVSLAQSRGKCSIGSYIHGDGFILEFTEGNFLSQKDRNSEIIFDYLIGRDLNDSVDQSAQRKVINFGNLSKETCESIYKEVFDIIKEKVKPQRLETNDRRCREKWWLFKRPTLDMYNQIYKKAFVMVACRVGKYLTFAIVPAKQVFDISVNVFSDSSYEQFAIYQSNIHVEWAWKYGSTMKTDLRYTSLDCVETFPFPQRGSSAQEQKLEVLGERYHTLRKQFMTRVNLGLTKTYNQFHNSRLRKIEDGLKTKEIEKQFGKETVILWKHLEKTENACSFNDAVEGILKLRELHKEMDIAVLDAYGWSDIDLKHDFYEVDYLPENDRIRYTISPEARKEVLKRLLKLNHEIHEQEVAQGLWDKKKSKKTAEDDAAKGQGTLF